MDHVRANDLCYGHDRFRGWPSDLCGPPLSFAANDAAAPTDPVPGGDENTQAELDRRLEFALAETFPASDPVSVICG